MKMKVYSIGRENGCDIVINDNSDVISRRHAILNVMPSGKMTIVDQSHNGTYVNGIKISPNVPVPVTRKDNISFAHISRLDWNQIPKPVSIMQYVIYGLIAIAVVIGGVVAYSLLSGSNDNSGVGNSPQTTIGGVDSCKTCKRPVSECDFKGKHPVPEPPDTCQTCKKPITDCTYKGKHPIPEKTCLTCGKTISKCKYNGKHPAAKCSTCGKAISECQYKGKHPEICTTCKKPIKECPYNGKHRNRGDH